MQSEGTLSNAWEQHLASEFAAKSTDQALATMSAEQYVNVVPLMIGARGRGELHDFYANHFLSQIPPDMEMVTVSRTIGQGRVVDELVARFTHSIRMDWILPGIPPTGKQVELPFIVIVQFEGDKVAHEHLYWDQASTRISATTCGGWNAPVVREHRAVLPGVEWGSGARISAVCCRQVVTVAIP